MKLYSLPIACLLIQSLAHTCQGFSTYRYASPGSLSSLPWKNPSTVILQTGWRNYSPLYAKKQDFVDDQNSRRNMLQNTLSLLSATSIPSIITTGDTKLENEFSIPRLKSRNLSNANHVAEKRKSPSILSTKRKECLVVVDVQPQFWSKVPLIRKDFPKFEQSIEHAIETFRKNNGMIVWIRCDYTYDKSKWLQSFRDLNPTKQHVNVCELKNSDSNGWPNNYNKIEWEPFAVPDMKNPNEYLVCKSNWNGVTQTNLVEILNKHDIDQVHVCGLITSICVQATAYGMFEAGLDVTLLEHCCGDRGKDRHNASLLLYKNYMYSTIDNENDVESIFPSSSRKEYA